MTWAGLVCMGLTANSLVLEWRPRQDKRTPCVKMNDLKKVARSVWIRAAQDRDSRRAEGEVHALQRMRVSR